MSVRRVLTLSLALLWVVIVKAATPADSTSAALQDTLLFQSRTHHTDLRRGDNPNWWINRIKERHFTMQDTTIIYPRFVQFCVNVYNWADRFFNTYDPQYVRSTGKRWRASLKSSNWTDSYATTFAGTNINMLSNVYSTIGPSLTYMAVSYTYEINLNRLFTGTKVNQNRFELNFSTSLFSADVYYRKNTGGTIIRQFGNYQNSKGRPWIHVRFPDLRLESYGLDLYYFFNHKRYSQGAAYSFSKYQVRSQGSFIAGLTASYQNVGIDLKDLRPDLLAVLPKEFPLSYTYAYWDYCALFGYGYNWVPGRHWLINVTVLPSLGWKHTTAACTDPHRDIFSFNAKGKTAFTYTHRQMFLGAFISGDLHWYKTQQLSFANTIFSFGAQVGFRF